MQHSLKFLAPVLLFVLFAGPVNLFAQAQPGDSVQVIEILSATKRLTFKTINDTTKLTIIAGDVKLKQGKTFFYCDSCVINHNTNIFEAWGHVHINDSDTTNVYANHLQYLMKPKVAYLDGDVKLTDGHGTLTTPDLEYDMNTNLGIYKHGGTVKNKNTVLTSQEGWYYSDIKDVYFKKNVVLKDPAYTIVSDSLLHNTENQTTRFISMTTITDSSGRVIKTKEGYYNQQTGKAEFGQRPTIIDPKSDIELKADNVQTDEKSGISLATGNAVVVDKKNKTTIVAGKIYQNKNTEAIMAILKPLMMIVQETDTIYITADTLFSARLTDLYASRSLGIPVNAGDSTFESSTDSAISINRPDTTVTPLVIQPESRPARPGKGIAKALNRQDSILAMKKAVADRFSDSTAFKGKPIGDSLANKKPAKDDTSRTNIIVYTTKGPKRVTIDEKDSSNRYFEAYRHVRIFNDSLQAVGDSMFYSFKDSVFRLYQDPVVWSRESQITGDTILLFTKNKKADRVQAFDNGFMVNKVDSQAFNQIKSTRMDGYFTNGDIDSVRARGYAQCIYYIQNDDSSFTGINESKSDVIDIYFRNKELHRVVFRSAVSGTIWPIRHKSPSEMRLQNFRWLENRRPKTKYEMYE
ncbi:MAG: OstA family protein [Bacteroidetes bacterium]|nr:MAG: OstA family protein [Bacteroidota bacterium]